ncbi:MAG: thiamine pyrophosphate-binding protein [Vicinamibacterales bacterium]
MSDLAGRLVERLRGVGTRALFGVPGGGGNLDLIEAAGRAGLPFVLTATETAAAIAAMAQAEVTGRPGGCLTTLGPGAASAVNGVACAYLDRAPMVVFTDSNPVGAAGMFAHQQLDQLALFAPVTKWSGRVTEPDAEDVIERAFAEVVGLPPGPVHLDCPGDVKSAGGASEPRVPRRPVPETAGTVEKRSDPLLLIGLGARQDAIAIRRFCERLHVPAMVTYKAKGVVPDTHPCFAGVFTNGAIEREIIDRSNLLIGVGLDPVELLPRPWTIKTPIVGISRWRMADDHVPFADQWVTDISSALAQLEAEMRPSAWDLDAVARVVREQRARVDLPASGLTPQRVIDVAARALASTSRVTVDAGAHMFPATMSWPVAEPNGMLISNGLSTMGFALPAAIGAALADRSRSVVALTGDGGLLMCAGELLTAAREKLRVMTVVLNDASLSLIEIKQQARRLPPAGVALGAVKWAALAESLGVAGFEAITEDGLSRALDRAAAVDGPSLIDVKVDRSVYGEMLKVIRG